MIRYFPLTFAWFGGLVLSISAMAMTPVERDAALTQVRNKIEKLRKDIAATQTQHDSVRNEFAELERRINEVHKRIRQLQADQRRQQGKLSDLQLQEKKLQQDVNRQQDLLAQQLRAAYMIGQQEYLKLWLNAQDPAAVSRTSQYYEYLHRARAEQIEQTQHAMDRLSALQQTLRGERNALLELQKQQQVREQELQERLRSRATVLARLREELKGKEQELATTLEDEKRLNKLVTALHDALPDVLALPGQRSPFGKLRGRLAWPTVGKVQNSFGKKRGVAMRSNGVAILTQEGREVRSVASGRVAYADWLRGYGMLVILDHGEGYMTLYGHNQAIYKEMGEWVQEGEVIAAVGRSGGESQSSLYFEIRHNGTPVNPAQWCRR